MRNKTLLISGGTGSLGRSIIELALAHKPKKIISYSRHEFSIVETKRALNDPDNIVRFVLGDVRDRDCLWRALNGVDYIIHAAALKNLETTEYSSVETVKTNVMGTVNVIDMAIDRGVKKLLVVSTDKCLEAVNLYGASKLCAEKLALAANVYAPDKTAISVVRFANFVRSSGSVVELFEGLKGGTFPITDNRCTRFFIKIDDAARFALSVLIKMQGGEVFCPKNMPSVRITDIAKAINPEAEIKEIGLRKGEKLHEQLEINGVRCSSSEACLPLAEVKELLDK